MDRLERVVSVLAEDQVSLQKRIEDLAAETRRSFEDVAERFRETERLILESSRRLDERIDRVAQQDQERARVLDERVDKLVIAIGEWIRRQNGQV